ncbi:MAG: LytR C-terminal domain-containing protein [Propionicimonas sp.]
MRQAIRVLKTPVTLILLLALVGFAAIWGYEHATAPTPARQAAPCVMTDVGGSLTPKKVHVRILNGGTKGGLAKTTQLYLNSYGFVVIRVNNTEEHIAKTVVVGNSVDDPEVKLVLGFFSDATARADGRADHVVDVLVGDQFATPKKPAAKSVPVSGPICLPAPLSNATATPSATPTKS